MPKYKENKDVDMQIEAFERNMPKAYKVENKLKFDSSMLPELKDWKVGEDYEVKLTITQLSAKELVNGNIEASFEVKKITTV